MAAISLPPSDTSKPNVLASRIVKSAMIFREAPDGPAGLQGERLVDRQVVDEGGRVAQGFESLGIRARRVHHHTGAELVVAPEVTVEVAGQHQRHHRAAGRNSHTRSPL